jgi:hypothetical protein
MDWRVYFSDKLKNFAKKDGRFAQEIREHRFNESKLLSFLEESVVIYSDTFQDPDDEQRQKRLDLSNEILEYLREHGVKAWEGISNQTRRLLETLDIKREDGRDYYFENMNDEYFDKRLAQYLKTVEFLRTNIQVDLPHRLDENEDAIAELRDLPKLSRGQSKRLKELRAEHTRLLLARMWDESSLRYFESIRTEEINMKAKHNSRKAAEDAWRRQANDGPRRDERSDRRQVMTAASGDNRTWEQFSAPLLSRGETELDVEVALAERPGIPYSSNRYMPDGLALNWFVHVAELTQAPTMLTWTTGSPTTRSKCVRVLRKFAPDKHPGASEDEMRKLGVVYAFFKTIVDYYDKEFLPEPIQALFKVLDAMHERVTTLEANFCV